MNIDTTDLEGYLAQIEIEFATLTEKQFQQLQARARSACKSQADHDAVDHMEILVRGMKQAAGS
jgi:hypothetical protein